MDAIFLDRPGYMDAIFLDKPPSGKVAHVICMLHASYMRRVLCMLP